MEISAKLSAELTLKQVLAQVVHGTSRMVSTAKILAPVITDNACRDQLLVSLDDIVAAVDSFKNHAIARSAENKTAEKATESVLGAVADLVTYLKESEDDPIMIARWPIKEMANNRKCSPGMTLLPPVTRWWQARLPGRRSKVSIYILLIVHSSSCISISISLY